MFLALRLSNCELPQCLQLCNMMRSKAYLLYQAISIVRCAEYSLDQPASRRVLQRHSSFVCLARPLSCDILVTPKHPNIGWKPGLLTPPFMKSILVNKWQELPALGRRSLFS